MNMKSLLIKTAICCMACDGEIADDEVKLLESSSLMSAGISRQLLLDEVQLLKSNGKAYLKDYINVLSDNKGLSEDDKIGLLSTAVEMIKADNVVRYSEIKFFKLIISSLSIPADVVLEKIEGIDEDWVEDDFFMT